MPSLALPVDLVLRMLARGSELAVIGASLTEMTVEDLAAYEARTKPKRKAKGASPTSRTLAECRKRGWLAGVVERVVPHGFTKQDLFGYIDLVVLDGGPGVLAIQATGDNGGDVQRRIRKIFEERGAAARAWLACGNRLEVWGWGKRGVAGKAKRWVLRVEPVILTDGDETIAELIRQAVDREAELRLEAAARRKAKRAGDAS